MMRAKTRRISIFAAHDAEHLPAVRELFIEYAKGTGLDLCFQGFETELATLPGKYAPPSGRLFLAREGEQPAGCAAVRKLADGICEMKRLYVRPPYRGSGCGRKLAEETIIAAREIGYERMRLDTLSSMTSAIQLYESLGFKRIPAYYHNPIETVVYLELALR